MNRLYFFCPDDDRPMDGVRTLYRHVDVLNANGFKAAVVHKKKGFRCTWFEHNTEIENFYRITPDRFDFVVIPEVFGPQSSHVFPAAKKVIFNQNAYYTFLGYSLDPHDLTSAYRDPDLVGVMVVSEDSHAYLSHAFPGLKIFRIHKSVDTERFRFRPLADKPRRIAFMGRKHPEEPRQVINILKFRGLLDDVEVARIDGRTAPEVAEILEQTLLFLSFGYPKGLPAAPLEAMLSGCLVVGYHGMGGREYFQPDLVWPVDVGDIVGFARTVEQVLRLHQTMPESLAARTQAAREFVLREYSRQREAQDILRFWNEIMMEQGHDAISGAESLWLPGGATRQDLDAADR